MDSEHREHLKDLRQIHQKRLRVLEQAAATRGLDAQPHIKTEIDDIQKEIANIDEQLGSVWKPLQEPPKPRDVPSISRPIGGRSPLVIIVSIAAVIILIGLILRQIVLPSSL